MIRSQSINLRFYIVFYEIKCRNSLSARPPNAKIYMNKSEKTAYKAGKPAPGVLLFQNTGGPSHVAK